MHICFACTEYPPAPHGGIGSFVQTLGRELVKRGHYVSVIGIYGYGPPLEGEEDDRGVRVIRVPGRGVPILRMIPNRLRHRKAFIDTHRERPIDIVEGSESAFARIGGGLPGLKLLRLHGGPAFFEVPDARQLRAERRSFRLTDEICAVSHCVAEGTRRLLNLGDRHIEVIPNPVDVEEFAPPPDGSEEEGLIVFTGTVTERKGIRELIEAMPAIVAAVPAARLEVYGGEAVPEPAVPFAKVLADSLPPHIAGRVAWKGRVTRGVLPDALRRASVCAYPSHKEAMPIGWLEGLATGKAVVASRTGPGPEIIDDGVTGLLCDPSSPASIAEKIVFLLKNSDERRRLGAAARKVCVERYSLPALVERNIEYYGRLLTARAQSFQGRGLCGGRR
jgi:glycosyltransferase involved in cell wall biosynthesis